MQARRSEGEPREDHPATHRHRGRRGSAGGQPGPGPDHGQRLHRCTHRDGQFTDAGHLVPGGPVTVGEPIGARPQRGGTPMPEHGRQRQLGQRDVAARQPPRHRLPHGRVRGPVAAIGGTAAIPAGPPVGRRATAVQPADGVAPVARLEHGQGQGGDQQRTGAPRRSSTAPEDPGGALAPRGVTTATAGHACLTRYGCRGARAAA
jgi:hypothetical protein